MNGGTILDASLAMGVLLTAVVALTHPNRIASVTVFLGFGVLLIGVWARLGAPDVALAEAALAAGVTGALLIAAVAHDGATGEGSRWPVLCGQLLVASAIGGALGVVFVGAAVAPEPDSLARQATANLSGAVVDHPVTVVLLDYRAYDTLLEIVVLAVAAIAALALHKGGTLRAVRMPVDRRPTLLLLVRALAPVLVLLAAWLLVAGSSRPGGAFQSGAVITGLMVLLLITGAAAVPTGPALRALIIVGAVVFVVLAVLTAATGGWLDLGGPWAAAIIVAVEAALALSIGVALAVLVVAQEASS